MRREHRQRVDWSDERAAVGRSGRIIFVEARSQSRVAHERQLESRARCAPFRRYDERFFVLQARQMRFRAVRPVEQAVTAIDRSVAPFGAAYDFHCKSSPCVALIVTTRKYTQKLANCQ